MMVNCWAQKKKKEANLLNSQGIKWAIGVIERSTFGPEKDATRTMEIPLYTDGRTYTDVDIRRTGYKLKPVSTKRDRKAKQ